MNRYKFSTNEFGVSETGFHLLRSNYNYETIDFKDITLLEITRGKLIRNWIIVFVIGLGLVGFSLYYTFGLIDVFNDDSIHRIYIEEIVVPILPFLFGGFCTYASMRNGVIIRVENNGKKNSYPLEEIIKKNEYQDFINYLKLNRDLNSKLKIYHIE